MKRVIVLFLTIIMMISTLCPMAMAVEDGITRIYTIEDLYLINGDMSGSYILMNDLDLTEATAEGGEWDIAGRGWDPIGSNNRYENTPFTGTLDGNNHKIIGMRIDPSANISDRTGSWYYGLFSCNKGTIKNLNLVGGSINPYFSYDKEAKYIGSIAAANYGDIDSCFSSVNINYEYSVYPLGYDYAYAGGICGSSDSGSITKCYYTGKISLNKNQAYYDVGGICGVNRKNSNLSNCYNTGAITCSNGRVTNLGGIVGVGSVSNCYNIGTSEYAISTSEVSSSYALSGKLTTGVNIINESLMKKKAAFVGWDFENTWIINTRTEYPYPQLQNNRQATEEIITSIELNSMPYRVKYYIGDKLELEGCSLKIIYCDSSYDILPVTEELITVDSFDSEGDYTANISYKDFNGSIPLSVEKYPETTTLATDLTESVSTKEEEITTKGTEETTDTPIESTTNAQVESEESTITPTDMETTEPEETTFPEQQVTTASPETDSTEPRGTTTAISTKTQHYKYLPSREQLENGGTTIKLVVQDSNGEYHTANMTATPEIYGGISVYTAKLPADIIPTLVQFQIYQGETWKSQVSLTAEQYKALEDKIVIFDGKAYVEELPTDTTETVIPASEHHNSTTEPFSTVTYADETTLPVESIQPTNIQSEPTTESSEKDTPTAKVKKNNPVKITAKTKTVKAKNLRKVKQTVKPLMIKNTKGLVKVVKVKSGTTSKIYKKITVNSKSGVITLKKAKYVKKTYKVKLKISVKGNSDYKAKTITKTVKIKII